MAAPPRQRRCMRLKTGFPTLFVRIGDVYLRQRASAPVRGRQIETASIAMRLVEKPATEGGDA